MADAKNSRLHPWHLFFGILASIATVVSCYVGYLTYLRQLQTNPGNPSAAQIAISTQPATTQALGTELYRQNRDRLIEILKKGQFYGLLTQPDGTQSAVDLRTNWDDTAGTASGDIHFADPDLRVNVGGQIEPQDPANGDQVTLSLASTNKDDGVFLAISAGSSDKDKPLLIGTYNSHDQSNCRLALNPGQPETKFEQLRDQLVAVIREGPDFAGTATDPDGNESPVNLNVAWNDESQKATGEFNFLRNNNHVGVAGSIAFDSTHEHVVLNLLNGSYDDNSFYSLSLAPSGPPKLTGTYHFRDSVTCKIDLHPVANEP